MSPGVTGILHETGSETKHVAVFYPSNPWPPRSGTHRRCLQMLEGLAQAGCRITLLSFDAWTDVPWDETTAEALRAYGVSDLRVHRMTRLDKRFIYVVTRLYRSRLYRMFLKPPFATRLAAPPDACRWFNRTLAAVKPDAIVMNYAMFDRLLDHRRFRKTPQVLETHDLYSLNSALRAQLLRRLTLPLPTWDEVNVELLELDFFDTLGQSAVDEEFRIMDRYTHTVAIAQSEAKMMRSRTRRTRVVYIPPTMEPAAVANTYGGKVLFPSGSNNPYNTHGLVFFILKVLPLILERAPDFRLRVLGQGPGELPPAEGVEYAGYVPRIQDEYRDARFMVSPVLGGTGAQIKIMEAMAHGLPVVAWRRRAPDGLLEDSVNGWLADNPAEFAARVVGLWQDESRRRKMGAAARAAVAELYRYQGAVLLLGKILCDARQGAAGQSEHNGDGTRTGAAN